jgi:membrane fusion protein, heavy metal efflux system
MSKPSNLLVLLLVLSTCRESKPPAASPPAKVENPHTESELTTVKLTDKAEARLGVRVAAVERRRVGNVRTYGGEVVVPVGRSIQVSAPVAATVLSVAALPGATVRKGQLVLRLAALPASSEMASAGVRVDAARKRVERAQRLVQAGAASQRDLEDARAELALAESATRPRAGGAMTLDAPQAGVIRDLAVAPGQAVAAGAPLFHVDAVETLWVRVPVYVGDLSDLERGRPARVRSVSASASDTGVEAPPVQAPPSADPLAATSDLVFQLPGNSGSFRPGQKVEAVLPLAGAETDSLVVPWSSVVSDIYGGTWVYENPAPHLFTRRRVEVKQVFDEWAVLTRGPAPGTRVVAVGAAEIFGAEFGNGK